jgi:uncharacterized protein
MRRFIGRESEREDFRPFLRRKAASLLVCQGRRRIGKSTFIRECAAEADHFLSFEGLPPREHIGRREQLEAFAESLAAQTRAPKVTLDSWPQAFKLLASLLPSSGSTVLLLDEISWLGIGEPDFAGYIKTAWDNLFSQQSRLVVVLCGSVSSWIQKNILNNTGFVGRCSWQFQLQPLPLPVCNEFWSGKTISACEKLKILAVTGGVPRYLEEIDPAQTAEQNIERLCFRSGGPLFNEFGQIFHDIFSRKAETYRDIVATLVDGPRSISEISKGLRRRRGGTLSEAMEDLESAGFLSRDIAFNPVTGKNRPRTLRYRICDNYLRFYLKYIEPVAEQIRKGLYRRIPLEAFQAWDSIVGLQFENLVLGNLAIILDRIGLSHVPVLNAGPYFHARTARRSGCQIDLLLRTKQSLYVFEVKFRGWIDSSVIAEVRKKIDCLDGVAGLSIRRGLIYQGEIAPEITRSDYFDHLVSFERLMVP